MVPTIQPTNQTNQTKMKQPSRSKMHVYEKSSINKLIKWYPCSWITRPAPGYPCSWITWSTPGSPGQRLDHPAPGSPCSWITRPAPGSFSLLLDIPAPDVYMVLFWEHSMKNKIHYVCRFVKSSTIEANRYKWK